MINTYFTDFESTTETSENITKIVISYISNVNNNNEYINRLKNKEEEIQRRRTTFRIHFI